ncbi:MAG: hypothetical protein WCO94_15035, partial [Verrucomicrobiota bacterium]
LHLSALMELGATICKSGKPDCLSCPVRGFCRAVEPEKIPCVAPRKAVIHERDLRVFAHAKSRVFLVRSTGPRWKGLWLLPPTKEGGELLLEIPYIVTRHRIRMEVFRSRPRAGWKAFDPGALPPMPTPHRRALEILLA